MKIDLTGKTAVVTGSTEGIGRAIALGLARTGATVVVNGRSRGKVDAAVAAIKAEAPGADVKGLAADLGSAEGVAAFVSALPATDILVNNVGIFNPQDFFEVPDEEWSRFLEVNVMSGVRLSRAYALGMAERGWGRIVFISSESGVNIPVEMVHYGVTKTAQIAVARGLAKRLAGTGVTVNSVLPGPTLSEGVAEMLKDEVAKSGKPLEEVAADFVKAHRSSSIIQRAATVEEVANIVVYACSKEASATTGAALRVDGGVVDTI
ncbi:SDR family oxidoreductase [Methylopila sp. M107]|uniref:SDR family NAD(P)-dependent oxidoreductase n=1 Tax=Methylopila sp. M107 TaxID=1101190 RepID=UPI0003614F17|nr:SDR family oxidoreductase [Methylopila sp. M107]